MSTPTDENAFLYQLEADVEAELALAGEDRFGDDLERGADAPTEPARYGRMVPESDPPRCELGQLLRAGGVGGLCDAAAAASTAPRAAQDRADSFADDTDSADDAAEAAGWPFFGQLIAHDITADRSPLTGGLAPEALRNARSPKLDLEMLYADGPIGAPYLYDSGDPAKFLLAADGRDVPRNSQGVALVGDPRNDSHLIALALHVALLRAHNSIVDSLRASGVPESDVFDTARTTLTWHHQWVIVHDFLPRLVGTSLVEEVLAEGGRWYAPAPGQAYIPLEFSHAVYRYGHGQIRHGYRLVADGPETPLFPDLVGFRPLPTDLHVDLGRLFDLPGHPPAQRAKRLDGRLPASLIGLPEQLTGAVDVGAHSSLAVRDLLRGQSTVLPSGEAIAKLFTEAPLTAAELDHAWPHGTPLWFYVLKEAQHRGDGDRLGPVGGRIVSEVLIGLLRADPASYLARDPGWKPTLPAAGASFGLSDLLALSMQ